MKKMAVLSLCIFVIAMFLISGTDPISGNITDTHDYYEKKEMINSLQCRHGFRDTPVFRILQHLTSLDNIDQSQEQNDGYYEIKEETWCAQSFIPQTYGKLTHVEIYMKKQMRSMFLPFLFKRMNDWWNQNLGNITLSIYDTLSIKNKEPLTSVTLSRDSIAKKDGWILFDVPDIDVWIGDTYYLVLHTTGGGDKNYYMWYYGNGDPYGNGMAYHNINGGEGSWYSHDFDFCFRTYGEYSGKEPDGIVDRFAVLMYQANVEQEQIFKNDITDMKNVLVHHGWKEANIIIKTANLNSIRNGISQMAETADQDDICMYFHSSHGGEGGAHGVGYSQLDEALDKVISNVVVIINACHSGSAIPYLKQTHRVILTGCRSNELVGWDPSINNWVFSYFLADETGTYSHKFKGKYEVPGPDIDGKYRDGAFARKSCDTNGDGWVSAEEAYRYVSYWVPKCWDHGYPHPQMYDGCDGELLITRIN
ncbi:MAG TPA: hypothetical protein ENG06_02645 [Thermoplasmatales archaeon]|nr:hypothetical protein [Thermoplasmatales archaeon]